MSLSRSNAYWAANRYADEAQAPSPTAPLSDLPVVSAARFRVLRDGLLALDGIAETVRYMGTSWRWAWEYGYGNRKLCWVHVVGDALSTTFTLSDAEEDKLRRSGRVPSAVRRAVDEAQRTGPVKWCWLALDDRRAVDNFLKLATWKAGWIAERPVLHRAPQLRPRRRASGGSEDSE